MHIATDEKFINSISWQFDKINKTKNKFIILLDTVKTEVKYVALKENFQTILKNRKGLQFCAKEINNNDITFFHGLNYFQSRIVLKADHKAHLVWCFWGGEFYDNPKALINNVIGEQTKKAFVEKTIRNKIKSFLRPLFYSLKNRTKTPEKNVLEAAKKIKYFGILYKEEMEYFRDLGYLSKNVSLFRMTYYPLEFLFKGIEHIKVKGQNILLGNSASLTNNHIEAFDILKDFNLEDRELIIPLSYGDMNYGHQISEIGKSIFGENIRTIFDFMPLDKFNMLLSSCNVVIMNHYRQQAVGNIIAMLWIGAKVYLNESNTIYHYLKRIGIFVFSIEKDLINNNLIALNGLNEVQMNHNKKILMNELSFNTAKRNLSQDLKSILVNVN
ncbi:TDP-N-acetylfucosamine:lipid II N-acetylfucosaminyltransferase [Yeosuana sp.]|uniref:TDP-N-acetylfucosamine:lipid II N-acetylfucosaminyltransferase n=1 Tax=Yeosuana sp. TaxID=2529388 RepID=UPI0040552F38